jgi:hypothetical protein
MARMETFAVFRTIIREAAGALKKNLAAAPE